MVINMDSQRLTSFLLWCTVINGGLLVFSIAGCVLAPDFGYDLQSSWFGVPRETVNVAIYGFLGIFKILWLIFNVVPYIALRIVGAKQRSMVPAV